jgi:hypothetical protein
VKKPDIKINFELIFATLSGGVLSNMALSAFMRRMQGVDVAAGYPAVTHGLCAASRDWAAERPKYSRDMAEIALAHVVCSKGERTHRRGDTVDNRRTMMAV